ncbi:MAG TPA: tRNA (guanosine(46)-N7)-methyltransferase TrmB [Spirochaetota bacterium]|nr:tRNA (guanosine(46)-N7)-methyltransferase TrmB [Spirochaetota bacterium]HPI88514.1 tRNA (guanosine(46)-N7)-methyltransferase TrmB [Spirochaetota bacterium]HPR47994.1 tRNA (guanosine(46)-N7)-methyltransferase TrmB [Spirochaetota bacterium]
MSRKPKLEKYSELGTFPNVIQVSETGVSPLRLSHRWKDSPFHGRAPLALEVGCGSAEHTLSMARNDPRRYCIGLDIKGNRLWHGARTALDENLSNALFIRMRAEYINAYFPEKILDEIWITFPDPHHHSEARNSARRLTSPRFLETYRDVLCPGGTIHLKTDDEFTYRYTLRNVNAMGGTVLFAAEDLYAAEQPEEIVRSTTTYEERFIRKNRSIKYLKCSL